MSINLAVLVLFGLTLALAVLPLLPSFLEWRDKTDVDPLRIAWESDVDIRYFANHFGARVERLLGAKLDACAATGETTAAEEVDADNPAPRIVPGGTCIPGSIEPVDEVILSSGNLKIQGGNTFLKEIYARGSVEGGSENVYRAILARGDLRLSGGSRSLRWLHSEQTLRVGRESVLHGRASADAELHFVGAAAFERIQAPRITFGEVPPEGSTDRCRRPSVESTLSPDDVPHLVDTSAHRWLVDGDVAVPPGVRVEEDLVATGDARIGRGAHLLRSIKSRRRLVLESDCVVEGSVVSGGELEVGCGCRIHGPVLAEQSLVLESGVVVGTQSEPTTVCADLIRIHSSVVVHGTVRAQVRGEALDAERPLETPARPPSERTSEPVAAT